MVQTRSMTASQPGDLSKLGVNEQQLKKLKAVEPCLDDPPVHGRDGAADQERETALEGPNGGPLYPRLPDPISVITVGSLDSGYADDQEDALAKTPVRMDTSVDYTKVFGPGCNMDSLWNSTLSDSETYADSRPVSFDLASYGSTEAATLKKQTCLDAETTGVAQIRFLEPRDTTEAVYETLSMPRGLLNKDGSDPCPKATETPASQSSSVSVMTQLTGTTDSDIAANMMTTIGAQDVYKKLLGFFSRFIEFKLRITGSQHQGAPSSRGNSQPQQKLTEPEAGPKRQTAKGKGKRVIRTDEGFDDLGEAPDDEEPAAKRKKTEKLKIACPYMKRYPTEFCSWRTCVGPGFDGMNRMKEHLKRRHFKENGCHRCGLYLESNQALQDHLRVLDICPVKVILPQMGFMTQIQSEEISKKRQAHTIPLLQRWKEIYLILFPDADEDSVPSPYFEASEVSDGLSNIFDPREYECFLKQHLPARILMNLNREFQIISDLAKAKLAEMLQEESLEVLKAFVLQKGGNLSRTSDQQTNPLGTERLASGANDNCLFDNIEAFGDEGQDEFDFSFLEPFCQQVDKEGSQQTDSGHGSSIM